VYPNVHKERGEERGAQCILSVHKERGEKRGAQCILNVHKERGEERGAQCILASPSASPPVAASLALDQVNLVL